MGVARWVVLLLCASVSAGAGQWLYQGTALPSASGWEVYGTSSYENGGGIAGTIADEAWKLVDASAVNRCLERNVSLGDVSFDAGATLVARMRCESASANCSYVVGVSNGNVGGMFLKLTATQLYLVDLNGYYRGSHALDGSAYHNYHVTVRNSTSGDNSTAVWRVYVDRTEVITWTGAGTDAGYDGVMAGHGGLSGTGTWHFDGVAARNDGAFTPNQWNPIPADPPAAPTVVSPLNGAVLGTGEPLIQWTAEAHDRYEVHINTTNSPTDANGWDSGDVASSRGACTGANLAVGIYYVFVRVGNPDGWSPWSPAGRSFQTSSTIPRPQTPTVIMPAQDGVTPDTAPVLQWTGDASDAYEIHLSTWASPDQDLAWDSDLTIASTDSRDVGPLASGEYYAFIRIHNAGGWSPWSQGGRHFRVDPAAVKMKQGWVLLRDEPIEYFQELLSHAPEYHVNMVHISHSLMMYIWEPLNDPARRTKINQITDAAHSNGVDEVVGWIHEIQDNAHWRVPSQYKTADGKIDMDQQAFWDWLAAGYEQFFDACPQMDGLVLTLTENFVYGGADPWDRTATKHTGKSPEDSCLKLIQTIWDVCEQRGKSFYVRNWTLYGGADRWIRNAIVRTGEPDIWMMSKATGAGDWDVIQEPYDIIGTCTGHPELLEFDVTGEYWGRTWTPWTGVNYMKHLWTDFAVPRGALGMVARIERDDGAAYEGPNRTNFYALDALAQYPGISEGDIYDYFCSHWFGRAAAAKVASALKRSFNISNACYNLPKPNTSPNYSFSDSVARDYCLASLFDLDCVSSVLKAQTNFMPSSGVNNYDVLRDPFERAAAMLSLAIPRTLFGDFTSTSQPNGTASCSVRFVDAQYGYGAGTLSVKYSSNAGATWTNYPSPSIAQSGAATDPFTVTLSSIPFGSAGAGRNKVRFEVTYPGGAKDSRDFTVKGLDRAYTTLGSSITGDGILHPQPQNGDGDTEPANVGGRSCRKATTSGDTNFYFHVDDGFCWDGSPRTVYLQVDYYGSAGSITPIYDSQLRTDETLTPVYLNGVSAWRTATWRLDDVNFGNRLTSAADFRLYVGTGANVYISGVRLYEIVPAGMLDQVGNVTATAVSPTQVALSWNAVPGATKYQVCRGSTCVGWPTGTAFTDSLLTPNTQYSYTVTAYDGSNFTSAGSASRVVTTLPNPPAITCSAIQGAWTTASQLTFTLNGSFAWGDVGYCRYTFDQSPGHTWSGAEPAWPAGLDPLQGWTAWRPSVLPTESGSGWLLYDGSTTQRCISEEISMDAGAPTWTLKDEGRVVNTKAKFALWPNVTINRSQGFTMSVRMKAADSALGWSDSGVNFGLNLLDCSEAGVVVRPDYLQLSVPGNSSSASAPANGYSYHTYTLTLRNSTYELYRDGQLMLSCANDDYPESMWSGPFFGHGTSNGVGTWSFQWISWKNGYYPPSPWGSPLSVAAPRPGGAYYMHLMTFNADGVPNGSVDLGPYYLWDGTTPAAPAVTDDGTYTTASAIHANYTAAAPSVNRYEYAIGTSPGAQDVLPFSSNGQSLELTRTGLSMAEGQNYFVSVRAVAGATGPSGSSDGIRVAHRYESISEAKAAATGLPVALYGKTVTAVYSGCFYVQDSTPSGIRVVTGKSVALGDVVDIAGVLGEAGGERFVTADAVFVNGE